MVRRASLICVVLAAGAIVLGLAGPTAARGGQAAAAAIPSSFKAQSITWTTPTHGWVLGTLPCGTKLCTEVIGTATGSTWSELGTVPAPIAGSGQPGVTEIRMGTQLDGWVFGPGLLHSGNGGRAWSAEPIPGAGKQVLDLATTATAAYAIVSPCAVGSTCSRRLSVWRTSDVAHPAWSRVGLTLPPNFAAMVAISHNTVYLDDPQSAPTPDAFYASTDGVHFSFRPVPCQKAQDGTLVAVAPTSATNVALLCVIDPGFGSAGKTVWRSTDTGKTDRSAGQTPLFGLTGLLAANSSGTLAVASTGARGSFLYLNTGGTRWTTPLPKPNDGGAAWNDLTFSSATAGWVVYGPANFSDLGVVYHSADGGRTWKPYSF